MPLAAVCASIHVRKQRLIGILGWLLPFVGEIDELELEWGRGLGGLWWRELDNRCHDVGPGLPDPGNHQKEEDQVKEHRNP